MEKNNLFFSWENVKKILKWRYKETAQSAGNVEYANCISADGVRPRPQTSVLDIILSATDGEAPVRKFGKSGVLFHFF